MIPTVARVTMAVLLVAIAAPAATAPTFSAPALTVTCAAAAWLSAVIAPNTTSAVISAPAPSPRRANCLASAFLARKKSTRLLNSLQPISSAMLA